MAKTPKPFVFPKATSPMVPKAPAMPNENKILRQFATKPVVKPMKVSSKSLTRAPINPLTPVKSGKVKVNPVAPADPLAPLRTYLP